LTVAVFIETLGLTTKTIPNAGARESETGACCSPEEIAVDLLATAVEGPAAHDELAAYAKAIAHPMRVRILRMLAKK
jgi:hypothetical protein